MEKKGTSRYTGIQVKNTIIKNLDMQQEMKQ